MEIDERDLRNIELLDKALRDIEEVQNNVAFEEFLQYRPLFLADTQNSMSREDIRLLSTRFIRRFNPYKPIQVFRQNKLLFTIPQIFVPIKDVSSEYIEYVNKFRSEGVSEIPKYSAEATQGLLAAILKSQEDVSETDHASYGDYIRKLAYDYKQTVDSFNQEVFNEEEMTDRGVVELPEGIVEDTSPKKKEDIDISDALSWQ